MVCVASTQIGKTHAYGCAALSAMWDDGPNPRLPTWWCCPTYKQSVAAQRVMVEVASSAGIMLDGPKAPEFKQNPPPPLVLINGAVCEYRTWDNPAHLMGDPVARVIVDEGGLLEPSGWESISTRRRFTRGPVWWIGNPGLKTGPFRKAARMAEKAGRLFNWNWKTLHDWYIRAGRLDEAAAYRQGVLEDRETFGEAAFRRNHEGRWTEDEAAAFKNLEECLVDGEMLKAGQDRFCIGVDVGQMMDYTAAVSMGQKSRRLELRERFRGESFPVAAAKLRALQQSLGGAPLIVEDNGIGKALIGELARVHASYVPFTTTAKSKEDAVNAVKVDMEASRLSILNRGELPYELERYSAEEYISGASIRTKYSAPSGEHDDTVMAALLARWGVDRVVFDLSDYGWIA